MPSESIRSRVFGSVILPLAKREKQHPHPLNRLKRQLLQIPIAKQLNAQRVDQVTRLRVRQSSSRNKEEQHPIH